MTVGKDVPFDIMTAAAGPGQPDVGVTSPSGRQLLCSVAPLPEGAKANFVPTEVGPHSVQVTFANQPVPGSPFTTVAVPVFIVKSLSVIARSVLIHQ